MKSYPILSKYRIEFWEWKQDSIAPSIMIYSENWSVSVRVAPSLAPESNCLESFFCDQILYVPFALRVHAFQCFTSEPQFPVNFLHRIQQFKWKKSEAHKYCWKLFYDLRVVKTSVYSRFRNSSNIDRFSNGILIVERACIHLLRSVWAAILRNNNIDQTRLKLALIGTNIIMDLFEGNRFQQSRAYFENKEF